MVAILLVLTVLEYQDHDRSCGPVDRESQSVLALPSVGYSQDLPTTNGADLRG
jgi:hypothetical protein